MQASRDCSKDYGGLSMKFKEIHSYKTVHRVVNNDEFVSHKVFKIEATVEILGHHMKDSFFIITGRIYRDTEWKVGSVVHISTHPLFNPHGELHTYRDTEGECKTYNLICDEDGRPIFNTTGH